VGTYTTIAEPVQCELDRIKGSRFIADAAGVGSTQEVSELVDRLHEVYPGASHHCMAYRLSSGEERSSDDGEPAGTAGRPILDHLRGSGLEDAAIVVTRFFGGTKLGGGGLVRAYSAAAAAILERVAPKTCHHHQMFSIVFGYDATSAVNAAIAAAGARITSESFAQDVTLHVTVRVENVQDLAQQLQDRTSGRIALTPYPVEPI